MGATTVDDPLREHDAVYLGVGAGVDARLHLPGEDDLTGIVATDFLVRANASAHKLLPARTRCAPTAARRSWRRRPGRAWWYRRHGRGDGRHARGAALLGASSVTCVFEGGAGDLHGRQEEHQHAREEGVAFRFGSTPVGFEGDTLGRVTAARCRRLGWNEAERGRGRAFGMAGAQFTLPADLVVVAVGYVPDPLLTDSTPGWPPATAPHLHADPASGRTSRPGYSPAATACTARTWW
ncbi:MAG: hypothetical protein U0531_18360 [Dehalococcoidia bacterium]